MLGVFSTERAHAAPWKCERLLCGSMLIAVPSELQAWVGAGWPIRMPGIGPCMSIPGMD